MAKKDNEQVKWMNPTQLAEVFVDYFDRKTLEDLAMNVAKHSYTDIFAKEVSQFLVKFSREHNPDDRAFFDLMETLNYALQHPEAPESGPFLDSFKFLCQFRQFVNVGATEAFNDLYAKSFMSQLDTIVTDNKVKSALLLKLADRAFSCGRGADKALVDMLAKNGEHISVDQWRDVLNKLMKRYISDFGIVWTIIEQMEKAAVKQIQAERSKVPYDVKALEIICRDMQNTTNSLINNIQGRFDAQQIQQQIRKITAKYDLSTILSADLEALEQLPKSGYEQAAALERDKAKMQQEIARLEAQKRELEQQLHGKSQEIEKINQELATARATLDESRSENETLREENAQLSKSKANSEHKLGKLIVGAHHIKSGLGSRGVNEYKQMVYDIEQTL